MAATFIDYDLMIIPDEITVTGMVIGMALGTIWPEIRPDPGDRPTTHLQGFFVGVVGLLVGAGLTQSVRLTAGVRRVRREAMGLGDVTSWA